MKDVLWCAEPVIWAMFYSTVVGFQYHPKNPPEGRMKLEDAAKVADEMYKQYLLRCVPPRED